MKKLVQYIIASAFMVSASLGVSIIDTDFTSPDYANNVDLTTHADWTRCDFNGSDHAFKIVEIDGTRYADTRAYNNYFNIAAGNYVYHNTHTPIGVNDEWRGSMTFVVSGQDSYDYIHPDPDKQVWAIKTNDFPLAGGGQLQSGHLYNVNRPGNAQDHRRDTYAGLRSGLPHWQARIQFTVCRRPVFEHCACGRWQCRQPVAYRTILQLGYLAYL